MKIGDKVKILRNRCEWNGVCSDHSDRNNSCIGATGEIIKTYSEDNHDPYLIEFKKNNYCSSYRKKDIELIDTTWNEYENKI